MFNFLPDQNQESPFIKTVKENQTPHGLRYLFLDFDGVFLSTSEDSKKLMKNIMSFVDEFQFEIVISSSWRINPEKALQALKQSGCTKVVYGMTDLEKGPRYIEIGRFLINHPYEFFFVLDDIPMGPLSDYAIQTDYLKGFNKEKLEEARRKLNAIIQENIER